MEGTENARNYELPASARDYLLLRDSLGSLK